MSFICLFPYHKRCRKNGRHVFLCVDKRPCCHRSFVMLRLESVFHKAPTNMASYQGRYLLILKQWNGRNSRSLISQSYVVHIKHVMSLVSYLCYFVPEHKQANFT